MYVYLELVNTLDSSLVLVLVPGSLLLSLAQPLLQLTQLPVPLRVRRHILPSVFLNLFLHQNTTACLLALSTSECLARTEDNSCHILPLILLRFFLQEKTTQPVKMSSGFPKLFLQERRIACQDILGNSQALPASVNDSCHILPLVLLDLSLQENSPACRDALHNSQSLSARDGKTLSKRPSCKRRQQHVKMSLMLLDLILQERTTACLNVLLHETTACEDVLDNFQLHEKTTAC